MHFWFETAAVSIQRLQECSEGIWYLARHEVVYLAHLSRLVASPSTS